MSRPTHFEHVAPDVRPTINPAPPLGGSERVAGVYADGDPEADPVLTLSDQTAYDLAVQLLAYSEQATEDDVRLALEVGGFPL